MAGRLRRVIDGVAFLTLADPWPTASGALAEIDRQLGRGIATPDHVLTVAGGEGSICPATEPQPDYATIEPYPRFARQWRCRELIYIADTGLLGGRGQRSRLASGVQADDVDPLPPKLPGGVQPIPAYTGHGTFVAGVIRAMAPAAEIVVSNAFSIAGSQLESDLVTRLEDELRRGVDIFHLSIAARSRHDLPLIAFGEWLKRLHQCKGSICIAPAGNNGDRRPNWPAAFPGVIAVGALGSDWHGRASFTNFGGWVDVYAPGRTSSTPTRPAPTPATSPPTSGQARDFYGMAKWSGTSFSTPIVTGLIAARMSRTGENAAQAAGACSPRRARRRFPVSDPSCCPGHGLHGPAS